jgi:hypothetical protein
LIWAWRPGFWKYSQASNCRRIIRLNRVAGHGFRVHSYLIAAGALETQVQCLTRTSHHPSTAAADPGMFTALRFLGLLDIL